MDVFIRSFKSENILYSHHANVFARYIFSASNPANIYMFKVSNRNTGKNWEICSKLTIKIPERQNDVNDVVLVFLLLTLNIFHFFS